MTQVASTWPHCGKTGDRRCARYLLLQSERGDFVRRHGRGGFGLIGDIVEGIVGAVIGGWLAGQLGIAVGGGLIASIVTATGGAIVLILILRLIRRA